MREEGENSNKNIDGKPVIIETRKRSGCPESFTEQDDQIVVREVSAKRVHTENNGKNRGYGRKWQLPKSVTRQFCVGSRGNKYGNDLKYFLKHL